MLHATIDLTSLKELTIVLPCYNPPQNWEEHVIDCVKSVRAKLGFNPHLVIVNDGSFRNVSDMQVSLIRDTLGSDFTWVSYAKNRGKGYALREGVKLVKSGLIIYTDIDFPYEESSFLAIYQELAKGPDIVPGHRGNEYYAKTPFLRKWISKFLRWSLKTFLRLPTDDSQCGIKGFNQKGAAVFLDTRIDRFLFDLEFLKLASKRKLSFQKVEVELRPNVVFSKVSFRILIREGLNFIKVLFRK